MIFASVLTSACDSPNIPAPSGPSIEDAKIRASQELSAAAHGRSERGTEDEILRLENVVPGLGGIFRKGDSVVVYLPEDISRGAALAALSRGSGVANFDESTLSQLRLGDRIKILPARFSFSQLIAWEDLVAKHVTRFGVSGIDVNEGANRITVIVSNISVGPEIEDALLQAGLPRDAFEIVVEPQQYAASSLQDTVRPAGAGMHISKGGSVFCTMGYNVNTGDNDLGFFTAGHCSPSTKGDGATGGVIYQPTAYPINRIGTVTRNPAWDLTVTGCAGTTLCTQVDAMYVSFDTSSYYAARMVIDSGLTDCCNSGQLALGVRTGWFTDINTSTVSPIQNQSLDKVGRTTGWSRGTLNRTCVNILVDSATTTPYRVLCADEVIGAYVGDGDSGAQVFFAHGNSDTEVQAFGILFAAALDSAHYGTDNQGNHFCNDTAYCKYYSNRLSRVFLYLPPPGF